MAVVNIKGARGRPLQIDPDKMLSAMIDKMGAAKKRLAQLRQKSSGERREELLGSETTLPESVTAAKDALEALKYGAQITHQTALMIRKTYRMLQQLASPQRRVYGRALSESLQEAYESDIQYLQDRALTSSFASGYLNKLKETVSSMTPLQRQAFLLSKGYQSPQTATKEYKRVKDWAENDYMEKNGVNVKMNMNEAWAYTLYRRAQDAL